MRDLKPWLKYASILLVIGVSVLILVSSLRLGIGKPSFPGPGFTAFLVSSFALVLSFFLFFAEMIEGKKGDGQTKPVLAGKNLLLPGSAIGVLIVFNILLKGFGYLFAAFFLLLGMFIIYNPGKWYVHIMTAAAVAALSFFLFERWLGVQFSPGDVLPIGW